MVDRSEDWFNQASRDLEQARISQKSGHHEWACFPSQQAAEKAVKALQSKEAIQHASEILEFVRHQMA